MNTTNNAKNNNSKQNNRKQYKGVITQWNDTKGYGFISVATAQSERRIFFHISAYSGAQRPSVNDIVVFSAVKKDGRLQADRVKPQFELVAEKTISRREKARRTKKGNKKKKWNNKNHRRPNVWLRLKKVLLKGIQTIVSLGLVGIWFIILFLHVKPLFSIYAVLSIILFLLYFSDKMAARNNRWRTSESKLHFLSLIGGWAGALVGKYLFSHKISKSSFVKTFYITVFINIAFTVYYAYFIHPTPVAWATDVWNKIRLIFLH
ncbi:MAG: hypothetical protein CR974_03160 [Gammaproteobacteria bacterium]|nr:MAG: hypothetical protein CR974_03160 [Gammaproteobacteria bacterium]